MYVLFDEKAKNFYCGNTLWVVIEVSSNIQKAKKFTTLQDAEKFIIEHEKELKGFTFKAKSKDEIFKTHF